jgi:hypothetical protein
MSFALLVNRVRSEFVEMPGLELTFQQAMRLWHLGPDDCGGIIKALVNVGFLRWTPRATVMWTGRDMEDGGDPMPTSVFVGPGRLHAKSVGS